jgi:cytoskeleton protein RodZ
VTSDAVFDMTSNPTETRELGAEAPGTVLRAARLAQNLGVGDVARQLKLSVGQVEALESGDFQRLPGPVFVRGFIRNYARLLRVDAGLLVDSVAGGLPREEPRPAAPPSRNIPFPSAAPRRWHWYALGLAVIVAALAAYEFFPDGSEPAVEEQAAPAPGAPAQAGSNAESVPDAAPQPAAAALSDEMKAVAPARPITGQPAARAETGAADGTRSAPQVAASAPAPDTPPAVAKSVAREVQPAPAPGERQVRMVFEQASWVEIRDRSGRAIFSQLNRPGTEQRVNGRPPLAVVVGNAHGVRLTYDERPVNLAQHTKVDVARLTLQ